jgi:ribose 5-phosphate isomerase A
MNDEARKQAKRAAAYKALEWVKPGMTIGLGTGSTAFFVMEGLGKKIKEGLKIRAIASSLRSESLARENGIELADHTTLDHIDITIDGADEVDEYFNLIKGGGGALVREKILASNADTFIVIVDTPKLVKVLGKFGLPVEVIPFGRELTKRRIEDLGCKAVFRTSNAELFLSDNGHPILDCSFRSISDPEELNNKLHNIPGVVETGLFHHSLITHVIVGEASGRAILRK